MLEKIRRNTPHNKLLRSSEAFGSGNFQLFSDQPRPQVVEEVV
jgi:hypothetical protein